MRKFSFWCFNLIFFFAHQLSVLQSESSNAFTIFFFVFDLTVFKIMHHGEDCFRRTCELHELGCLNLCLGLGHYSSYFFNNISTPFSLSLFFWDAINMHRLLILMVFHKSWRLPLFLFILFSFCFSGWVISNNLFSRSLVFFFWWFRVLFEDLDGILQFGLCVFQLQNFCLVLICFLSLCRSSHIVFLILLNCLTVFLCSSLNIFITIILNSFLGNPYTFGFHY